MSTIPNWVVYHRYTHIIYIAGFPDFTVSSTNVFDIRALTPTFHCQVTDNTCAAEGDPAKLRTIYAEKLLEQARIERLSGMS